MSIHRRETKKGVRYDVRIRRPDGMQVKKTFRTKRDAQRFEAKQFADREQGTWIDPHAGRITFAEWSDEWFATMAHSWRRSTAARHRVALDSHWLPGLGHLRMSSITPRQIQQIVNDLAATLKPSTIRSYYGTVRSLFGDAVDQLTSSADRRAGASNCPRPIPPRSGSLILMNSTAWPMPSARSGAA